MWFHFDRLRFGGLAPCQHDKVRFTVDDRRKQGGHAKDNRGPRALKVELIELEPVRTASTCCECLERLLAEMTQTRHTALLRASQCPPLWIDVARVCNDDSTAERQRGRLTAHLAKLLKLLVTTPQESADSLLFHMTAGGLFDRGSCLFSWAIGERAPDDELPAFFTADEVTTIFRKAHDSRARLLPFVRILALLQGPEQQVDFCMGLLRAATVTVGDITYLDWADLPLIITTGEFNASRRDLPSPVIQVGPYNDTQHYFEVYFRLLREDCFAPLRDRVREWREGQLDPRDMQVFTNVTITDIGCPDQRSGGGTILWFNLAKQGAAAKQLMYGNLVAMSPRSGDIRKPMWGTICSRESTSKLDVELCTDMNGSIDDATALEMLLGTRCILAVSPTFYRAYEPVLRSLQSMRDGVVDFQDELVQVNCDRPTKHADSLIGRCATVDGSILYSDMGTEVPGTELLERLQRGDRTNTTLDASQMRALEHVLTNRLATVQGPPGTGKTFIGVRLVRLLLSMQTEEQNPLCDGPILVLTYKNHALDDFLVDCLKPDVAGLDGVARVGGHNLEGSKLDSCNIRTLVQGSGGRDKAVPENLREAVATVRGARTQVKELETKLMSTAEELAGAMTLSVSTFKSENCLNQLRSLILCCPDSVFKRSCRRHLQGDDNASKEKLFGSLDDDGDNSSWTVVAELADEWGKQCDFGSIDEDDGNQSAENKKLGVKSTLDERSQLEEEERIASVGTAVKPTSMFKRAMIKLGKRSSQRLEIGENDSAVLMNEPDIWTLTRRDKAMLAQAMLSRRYQTASTAYSLERNAYVEACMQLKKAREIEWVQILRQRKLLGMTITGASIHSSMLQQLKPSVVIVEEAAEILEPQLVATLGPHVKQLVMIGDHKQLRPSVEHHSLVKDCHFDISMMERLVNNALPFATLEQQGRMRPELAVMLREIYPELKTNEVAVTDESRPAPRCMSKSLFWWDHSDEETIGRSPQNEGEADRVVKLALFFITQGYSPSEITVLGAYSGQVTLLRQRFEKELPAVWSGQLSNEAERHRISEIEVQLRHLRPGMQETTARKHLELSKLYAARLNDGDLGNAMQQCKAGLELAPKGSEVWNHLTAAMADMRQILKQQDELYKLWISREGTTIALSKMARSTVELARRFQMNDKLECSQATFGMLAVELKGYQKDIDNDHPDLDRHIRQKVLDRLQMEHADTVSSLGHLRRDINGIDVQTVDRYQGAENSIVIVSLVRSERLGYLTELNRRCVAQSRAKCGLYFVGNAALFEKHATWAEFLAQLTEDGNVGTQITLRCSRHPGSVVDAETADDIDLNGGVCQQTCLAKMAFCDHWCHQRCHADTGHLVCDHDLQVTCSHGHVAIRKCSKASDERCVVCDRATKDREEHKRNLERIAAEHSRALEDAKRAVKLRQQDRERLAAEHQQKRREEELRQQQRLKDEQARAEKRATEMAHLREIEHRRKLGEQALREVRHTIMSRPPPPLVRELQDYGSDASEYRKVVDRTELYAQSGHAIPMKVTRIERVTNLRLEEEWYKAKLDLCGANHDSELLFHGTSVEGVKGITKTGFRLPERSENNMFGCGVYFATDSTKSAQELYTKGSKRLLLCDVVLGKQVEVVGLNASAKKHSLSKHIKQSSRNRPYLDVHLDKVRKGGFDSVYAKRGTRNHGGVEYDEFIIYDQRLALPKYIVHFGNGSGGMSSRRTPAAQVGQKIELKSRKEAVAPDAFLASHYDRACTQFREMIGNTAANIVQVDYYGYEHSRMQTLYGKTKSRFCAKGKTDEVWVFHGTTPQPNIESIMTGGFKVGGQDGHPIANGAAFGQGVYSATGLATPMQYGGATKAVILAMALPGVSRGQHQSNGDSWRPKGDWYIFAKHEQVLPCYVVRYT